MICFLLSSMYATEEVGRLCPQDLAREVHEEFQAHADLVHQSRGKNIVAFLGETGSGKSTLINFLAGKEMSHIDGDTINLAHPEDSTAMKIAAGRTLATSETVYPKSINVMVPVRGSNPIDCLFYDLPGFRDTRGTTRELMNAAFIRQILIEANTVRLVIVASEDNITSSKGANFKAMIDSVQRLLRIGAARDIFQQYSVFILTKSDHTDLSRSVEFITERCLPPYQEVLGIWTGAERFCQMAHVRHMSVNREEERDNILTKIGEIEGGECPVVDVSAIYRIETISCLEGMFSREIEKQIDDYLGGLQTISALSLAINNLGETDLINFWAMIDQKVKNVPATQILLPFCDGPYQTALKKMKREKPQSLRDIAARLTRNKQKKEQALVASSKKMIQDAIESWHGTYGGSDPVARLFSFLDPNFHKHVYDTVCGRDVLDQITHGDEEEKAVIKRNWDQVMEEFGATQSNIFRSLYGDAKKQGIT